MGVPDHTDHGPSHRKKFRWSSFLCKESSGLGQHCSRHACEIVPDQHVMTATGASQVRENVSPARPVQLLPRERLRGVNRLDPGKPAARSAVAAGLSGPFSHGSFAAIPRVAGSPSAPPKSSGQNPFGTTSALIAPRR